MDPADQRAVAAAMGIGMPYLFLIVLCTHQFYKFYFLYFQSFSLFTALDPSPLDLTAMAGAGDVTLTFPDEDDDNLLQSNKGSPSKSPSDDDGN